MKTHDIGDEVTLEVTATNRKSGEPQIGTGVFTVLAPDGTTSTPAVTASEGTYSAAFVVDLQGTWHYAFDLEGSPQAAQEGEFKVRERKVPR